MNIFEHYQFEIQNLVKLNKDFLKLENLSNLPSINLEIPPEQFNFDLSCNIALILAKSNQLNPQDLSKNLKILFDNEIKNFEKIEIAGPGFLNIKLSKAAMIQNINSILINTANYGSNKKNETYNIEFVSANPTGPMHVGHCSNDRYRWSGGSTDR